MEEKEFLFTKNQDKLLSMGIWAKYLAWIILIAYSLLAVLTTFQDLFITKANVQFLRSGDSLYLLRVITIISNSIGILLKGFVFYVILKTISLSSRMIVETDINYREQKEQGGEL